MEIQVPRDAAGLRLGQFLFDRVKVSRSLLRRLRHHEGIHVDGRPARVDLVLQGGEVVSLLERATDSERVQPEPIELDVLYEDAYLLVVNKPSGMVVHPVRDYTSGTLANAVAYHLQSRGKAAMARPVHRLDRETSGLLLFAKTTYIHGRLAAQLEAHKLERSYVGLVHGVPVPAVGTVSVPIRRVWDHPVKREAAVGPRAPEQEVALAEAAASGQRLRADWMAAGLPAVTHYQVIRAWPQAALLALQLETGRTHQIRVHMAHLGHPLLGDELYGTAGPPGRQALHAASLAFRHPISGQVLRFESPLPPDLRELMAALSV